MFAKFGPTWRTMVLCPTVFGLLQQDIINPPHPPSTIPPCNQQKRKNSQDPVKHWAWSPTKNLSLGGGARLRKPGRVKKNLSFVFQASGRGPCWKSSLLTRAEAEGRNSPKVSSFSSPKKSSSSPKKSLRSSLLSGELWRPTPIFSRRIWSLRTCKPRSKDKSCCVKLEESGLGSLGSRSREGPDEDEECKVEVEDDNNDDSIK